MSLAEDLRRSFAAATPGDHAGPAAARRTVSTPPRAVSAPKAVPTTRKPEVARNAPVEGDDSFNLLDRAAKSIVFLLGRYRQLEEHVRQLDAWSKAQIQAAEAAAQRWQDASAEAERKVHELQQAVEAANRRAEVAEQAIKRDRDTLAVLQERIIASFGLGSEAHDALAALDLE